MSTIRWTTPKTGDRESWWSNATTSSSDSNSIANPVVNTIPVKFSDSRNDPACGFCGHRQELDPDLEFDDAICDYCGCNAFDAEGVITLW